MQIEGGWGTRREGEAGREMTERRRGGEEERESRERRDLGKD